MKKFIQNIIPTVSNTFDGIELSNGKRVEPALQNSFANEKKQNWQQRNFYFTFFLIICFAQLFFSISISSESTEIYDATFSNFFYLGDMRPRGGGPPVIEIDEIFGNQYVDKNKKLVVSKNSMNMDGDYEGEGVSDLSYFPGIPLPRPLRSYKMIYPQKAREQGIEADALVEVIIDKSGIVKEVQVLGVSLRKQLPEALNDEFTKEFAKAARQILLGHPYSPSVVEGEARIVRTQFSMPFELMSH